MECHVRVLLPLLKWDDPAKYQKDLKIQIDVTHFLPKNEKDVMRNQAREERRQLVYTVRDQQKNN